MSPKKLSRRDFLKLTGALSAGGLLAACAPLPAAPAPQAPAAPTAAPAETAAPPPKEAKTLVLAIQAFAHDALKPVLAPWEAQTGNTVALESGPASGEEMMTKYAPALQSGSSPVDVFSVDDVSGPAFTKAGWILPLDDVIPAETWADFPESFLPPVDQDPFHSYEGKRYRVPHEFAVGYFWYRKDWFDEQKIAPPKTWDEFVQIGKAFTKDPVWGTTEGMKKPGLTFVYLAYLAAQAGSNVFDFDDGVATAFQYCYDLIHTHKIMSDTVLNQDYTQQNDLYMKDRIAMMRQWPYFYSVVRDNKDWWQEGKAEITLPPAGPGGPKTWWGGWGFSVPMFAPNLEEAKSLIAWITNNQNAPILANGQSWFVMPRKSILDVMKDGLPIYMKMYSDNNCLVPRPYNPRQADAEVTVDDVGQLYLTDQMSLADAMKTGKERIAALG
jgi:ABC-type glycerol-3-phosphate transport system substrate-binding protein